MILQNHSEIHFILKQQMRWFLEKTLLAEKCLYLQQYKPRLRKSLAVVVAKAVKRLEKRFKLTIAVRVLICKGKLGLKMVANNSRCNQTTKAGQKKNIQYLLNNNRLGENNYKFQAKL